MIDYDKLICWPFPELRHDVTSRDVMLYALGVGFGADPLDKKQLRFVYEKNLVACPSMASILCAPGNWLRNPDTGVDYLRLVNGGTRIVIHQPLPLQATLTSTPRVTNIIDNGAGKGAIVVLERNVFDKITGDLICTVENRTFCRGDGGFGGPKQILAKPPQTPNTKPKISVDLHIARNAGLLYRLNGDYNPLHADPEVATQAGFSEPILHGLCSFGLVTHAILKACCDYDPSRLRSLEVRYTSPVIPGETIRTEIWQENSKIQFRAIVHARNAIVLDNGLAEIKP